MITNNDPRYSADRRKQLLKEQLQTIDDPTEDNIVTVLRQVKEAIETLNGSRGSTRSNTVTYQALEALGLVTVNDSNGAIQNNFIREAEDWHEVGDTGEPGFESGWVNYGGSYETAAFYKDPFGIVHIKGLVKSGTLNNTIFTLPDTGYRPLENVLIPAVDGTNGAVRLDIAFTGAVATTGASSNGYQSINAAFRVD